MVHDKVGVLQSRAWESPSCDGGHSFLFLENVKNERFSESWEIELRQGLPSS